MCFCQILPATLIEMWYQSFKGLQELNAVYLIPLPNIQTASEIYHYVKRYISDVLRRPAKDDSKKFSYAEVRPLRGATSKKSPPKKN